MAQPARAAETIPLPAAPAVEDFTAAPAAPDRPNLRWFVCFLLFLATTVNYMDRSVLSLIEPLLHTLPFMGWDPHAGNAHQTVFNTNYKHMVQCFQLAYGIGLLTAGRLIDRLGTRIGYALAIGIWALSSMGHALVFSVTGFCIARLFLGLGESGNFPAAIKATTEWFPTEQRALATGLFNSGSNVSFFIAPVLVAWATGRFGWQAGFLATGSLGLLWLVLWLLFPYNRLRRASTQTQINLGADFPHGSQAGLRSPSSTESFLSPGSPSSARSPSSRTSVPLSEILRRPGLYAFSLAKALTDPIWWFYLFYLPKFLHETYGLDLLHARWEIVTVYMISSLGSIFGGGLSGWRMNRGHSVNAGRKFALLLCACLVVPIVAVPHLGTLFPTNAWPATLLIALAAAAHQGWSANLFSTPTDMFPSTAISTVVGIGGAAGSFGAIVFTGIVGSFFSLHPLLIFALAGSAYLVALAIFQLLVPHLGAPSTAAIPPSTPKPSDDTASPE